MGKGEIMNLIHFTDKPLQYDKNYEHHKPPKPGWISSNENNTFKPSGLWVSDEDEYGWKEWCEGEGFHEGCFEYAYQIIPYNDSNILVLSLGEQLESFTVKYPSKTIREGYVDWNKVMTEYDGIIITPYQGMSRLRAPLSWYYSWDCASGCFWNPVFDIEEMKK